MFESLRACVCACVCVCKPNFLSLSISPNSFCPFITELSLLPSNCASLLTSERVSVCVCMCARAHCVCACVRASQVATMAPQQLRALLITAPCPRVTIATAVAADRAVCACVCRRRAVYVGCVCVLCCVWAQCSGQQAVNSAGL